MTKQKINNPIVREWFLTAKNDEFSAESIIHNKDYRDWPGNSVCFLSQQMAEKCLKGYLVSVNEEPPKIHDIEALLKLCVKFDESFINFLAMSKKLSGFYVATRYPGDYEDFSQAEAKSALEDAKRIKDFVMDKIFANDLNKDEQTLKCPNCQPENLKKAVFYQTEIDYCPKCLGLWFDKGELSIAKNEKDEALKWLDVDLWQDKTKFHLSKSKKFCPKCLVPFYEVAYDNSDIKVDLCNLCSGVWLDRGEFKKIIDYLKHKEKDQVLYNYLENLANQASEIFKGPETLKEEVADFMALIKLLKYKFLVQHPYLIKIIGQLPK